MQKYSTGLLIGRFQPFHNGHLWLIKHALKFVDKLVIGIGSANVQDKNNPLGCEERKKMAEEVIVHENLSDQISKIVPLDDFHDDEKWFQNTLRQTGPIDAVIGNNEWVNDIFEKQGYPILRVGYYKRYILEGEKIRQLIKENKPWENRIPNYLLRITNYELKKKIRNP